MGDLVYGEAPSAVKVEYYRAALAMVRKEVLAGDYAALKTRLSLALHNLAQATGEPVHLKDTASLDDSTREHRRRPERKRRGRAQHRMPSASR
jgi:hypothetical protein